MVWRRILSLADLPVGAAKPVRSGVDDLLVCRLDAEAVQVLENVCSHDDAPLGAQELAGGCVTCPRHGARFEVTTGAVKKSPAPVGIDAYRTRLRDGWVEADLED